MSDRISSAAGRVVDDLSRRRFLGWLGGGGTALAALFGLDRLRSDAFAQGLPQCETVPPFPLPHRSTRCVRRHQCNVQAQTLAAFVYCGAKRGKECGETEPCPGGNWPGTPFPREFCAPVFRGSVTGCRIVGECEDGRVLCECTAGRDQNKEGPDCACECTPAPIPPSRP